MNKLIVYSDVVELPCGHVNLLCYKENRPRTANLMIREGNTFVRQPEVTTHSYRCYYYKCGKTVKKGALVERRQGERPNYDNKGRPL